MNSSQAFFQTLRIRFVFDDDSFEVEFTMEEEINRGDNALPSWVFGIEDDEDLAGKDAGPAGLAPVPQQVCRWRLALLCRPDEARAQPRSDTLPRRNSFWLRR